jgi:hypothetical protein
MGVNKVVIPIKAPKQLLTIVLHNSKSSISKRKPRRLAGLFLVVYQKGISAPERGLSRAGSWDTTRAFFTVK